MSTFLRLELPRPEGEFTLVNVDHIVRIHPTWPKGCTLVLADDTSLNVRASFDEIQARLRSTGGRVYVAVIDRENDHGVDELYEAARADLLP
jgi:hypothetical protein